MCILIVEDEEHLATGLRFNFEAEGYKVTVVGDGHSALSLLRDPAKNYRLVILDLMLPGLSGYDTCTQIRTFNRDIKILILSARSLSEDKTRGFDCGTDQYMTKPFELKELLSRVRNLLDRDRRPQSPVPAPSTVPDIYEFAEAHIDFRKFEVTVGGETRLLTAMEMQLLRFFVENEGRVLSRAEILDKVWDIRPAPSTRTVDNFVMRLRRMFEEDPAAPRHFLSLRGAGYRFDAVPRTNS